MTRSMQAAIRRPHGQYEVRQLFRFRFQASGF